MKTGPGANRSVPPSYRLEPVTSTGRRSGVPWIRFVRRARARAIARARSVLPVPGDVLDEDVAVGEERGQDEPERLLGADDRPADRLDQVVAEMAGRPGRQVRRAAPALSGAGSESVVVSVVGSSGGPSVRPTALDDGSDGADRRRFGKPTRSRSTRRAGGGPPAGSRRGW